MKLRTGVRANVLHLQLGDEPSADDPLLAITSNEMIGAVIADAVNKYSGGITGPHRIRHAALGTEGCCR